MFEMVGVLARRRYLIGEKHFSSLGLNHSEARLITLLSQGGGAIAQDALTNAMHIDRSNAGRALKRLEQDGYVVRRKDAEDKRANFVRMTDKGRKAAGDIVKLRKRIAQTFFGDLSEREAEVVLHLLGKALVEKNTP
ncbi:MAG: MarR family transcriptional regulator [Rhodospirillaceae bacterium]|nr:MarR family transcriptional regulator [Rhodospirillaceae bacterium]